MTNLERRCIEGMCTGNFDPNQASQKPISPQYYGTNVAVTCNTGYRASTSASSTCDYEESYLGNCSGYNYTSFAADTACQQIKCGALNSIRSSIQGKGKLTSSAAEIGYADSFNVTCNTGYRVANHLGPTSSTVTCGCPWVPDKVNCSAVRCLLSPFPPVNADVVTGWSVGQEYPSFGQYTVQCNRGYLLHSGGYVESSHTKTFIVECQDNGSLTNTQEHCALIPCHSTQADPNQLKQHPLNGTVQNESTVVTCNGGYRASRRSTSTCNQSEAYIATCDVWEIVPVQSDTACRRVFCDLEAVRSSLQGTVSSASLAFEIGHTVEISCNYGTRFGGGDPTKKPSELECKLCLSLVCKQHRMHPCSVFCRYSCG